ncbi:sensor histidine kinase [Actinoplanes flavus]|uniref:histidine kinase n=1 Tax=Actinoplanes flavus TaxID=2820290 RepID=A0ABS3UTH2_9ACTN|nr:sensor histidine kinase [Actinoplanes flavus]MBO3741874.1 sensor domain-containing protein [Actinoplanes flavus]
MTAVLEPQSWRELGYLLLVLPIDVVSAVLLVYATVFGVILSITPLGPWLLAGVLRAAAGLGARRRGLAARLIGEQVPAPVRSPAGPGAFGWRRAVLSDPAGWKALAYPLAKVVVAPLSLLAGAGFYVYGFATLTFYPLQEHDFQGWVPVTWVLGLVIILLAPWMVRLVLFGERLLIRGLLGPSRAGQRMSDLRESRDRAVKDADVTLRRIERDLHDGAQARLIGVGMHLAMVRELIAADAPPESVVEAVDTAQDTLATAVSELRDLVRGIHPPVLDNGLEAALATVAAGSPVPVAVEAGLPRRPPPALESIAYFTVCELLTNAGRHSGAAAVTIRVDLRGDVLRLRVHDDGRGGAFLRAGGGLAGLSERIRVVDGRLSLDSPAGGPTTVTVEIPCPAPVERP